MVVFVVVLEVIFLLAVEALTFLVLLFLVAASFNAFSELFLPCLDGSFLTFAIAFFGGDDSLVLEVFFLVAVELLAFLVLVFVVVASFEVSRDFFGGSFLGFEQHEVASFTEGV